MRVYHRMVLTSAIITFVDSQGLNEPMSYVNYDGWTDAHFETAGADGYQIIARFGRPYGSGTICDTTAEQELASLEYTAAFCKDRASS